MTRVDPISMEELYTRSLHSHRSLIHSLGARAGVAALASDVAVS